MQKINELSKKVMEEREAERQKMQEINYSFKQESPSFGIEEMKREIDYFYENDGRWDHYDGVIFSLESDEFLVQLWLDALLNEDDESCLKIMVGMMKMLNGEPQETIEVEDASFELNREEIQLSDIKRYLVSCLMDCYLGIR